MSPYLTPGVYVEEEPSAVKPIALNMVAEIARDPATAGLPISGIGGISNWRDAAEFIALGAGSVQVCTAAMLHGFRIVEEMQDGLARWMDARGYADIAAFSRKAVPRKASLAPAAGSSRTLSCSSATALSFAPLYHSATPRL